MSVRYHYHQSEEHYLKAKEIYEAFCSGSKKSDLARKYGLSKTRIANICYKFPIREERTKKYIRNKALRDHDLRNQVKHQVKHS